MHLTDADIQKLDRIQRLNIINSVTGIKPANLIGTISNADEPNLAIFSSVVHLGSKYAGILLKTLWKTVFTPLTMYTAPLFKKRIIPPQNLRKMCRNLKSVSSMKNISRILKRLLSKKAG